MSSQVRNLIIGVVVIVVAAAAYFGITSKSKAQEEAEAKSQEIFAVDENVKEIHVSSAEEEGVFVKSGINWVIVGKEYVELSQIDIDQAAAYVKTLTSVKDLGTNDKASYGIDEGVTFTIITESGSEYTVTVGDEILDGQGYYAYVPEYDNIYVIDSEAGKAIKKNISDYRDRNPEYVDYSQLEYMKITRQGKDTFTIVPNPDGEIEEGLGEYILTEGFPCEMPVLTDALAENVGGPVYEITAQSFIDDPESDEVYGFDDPYMVIELKDSLDLSCIITVGDPADDGTRYAKFSGKDYVCTVKNSKTDLIYNADLFSIIGKYYVNVPVTDMSSLTISTSDTVRTFTVDSENGKIFADNVETDIQSFSTLYGQLAQLTIDGRSESEKFGNEVLTIDITFSDGTEETIEFFDYDNNYYGSAINGEKITLTGKGMVDSFIESVKSY